MSSKLRILTIFFTSLYCIAVISCKHKSHAAVNKQIVQSPADMNSHVAENIKDVLQYAQENGGKINDSVRLTLYKLSEEYYAADEYKNIWNKDGKLLPLADSLYEFIDTCNSYGLFPSDYHFKELLNLKNKLATDSLARKDAITWTKIDLMLTDGFFRLTEHLKKGRIIEDDSAHVKGDTHLQKGVSINALKTFLAQGQLATVLHKFESDIRAYDSLKQTIPAFLDSIDRTEYTHIDYPWKDSIAMLETLQKRLEEEKFITDADSEVDSLMLAKAIKKAQRRKGLAIDGKVTPALIKRLNLTWKDYFKKIALNLDRYKSLIAPMPEKYIWVNLPSFYLKVYDHDTVALLSRVVVGKPTTPTPVLSSAVSNMVTYPQWTIPSSIIKKEVLPALKKDPGYLARKGFSLVDSKGAEVDPHTVKWKKYTDDIPYKVVQGSGDDNALGVFKFNFYSPFDIYLHDTNQRNFFKNKARALSHGCVRVQEWEKLAEFVMANDSMLTTKGPLPYNMDSIKSWLAVKAKKTVYVRNRLPLFIRYFTAEAEKGHIRFYDDIYDSDNELIRKYYRGE